MLPTVKNKLINRSTFFLFSIKHAGVRYLADHDTLLRARLEKHDDGVELAQRGQHEVIERVRVPRVGRTYHHHHAVEADLRYTTSQSSTEITVVSLYR